MIAFAEAFRKISEGDPARPNQGDKKPTYGPESLIGYFHDSGVALYGCGQVGRCVAEMLVRNGVPILGICDSRRTGVFPATGQTIMTPHDMRQKHPGANILICTYYPDNENQMTGTLGKLGYPASQIYYFSKTFAEFPSFSIVTPQAFLDQHYDGYKYVFEQLADDLSRQVLLDTVRMYLTGQPIPLSSNSTEYFEQGLVALSNGEVFVDGGAYAGETALQFIKECAAAGVRDWRIYSFEANPQKADVIKMNLERYPNVEVIMKGLWSHEADLTFNLDANDGGSSLMMDGVRGKEIIIPVISLDAFFESKPLLDWPTFIKMDIEGAEVEALNGARNILCNKRPKLALCVYHHVSHPYELLRIAQECNPDYRFYLRQYALGYYETVLYAV